MSTADRPDIQAAMRQALVDGGVVPPPLVDRQALIDVIVDCRSNAWGYVPSVGIADAIITSGVLRDANEVRAKAWDLGWHAHYIEWAHQRKDPTHPITKENPYREAAS